jgi:signal transduction histidine kinase
MKLIKKFIIYISLFILPISFLIANEPPAPEKYMHKETKDLVKFVEHAAELVSKYGEKSFDEFRAKNSMWFHDNTYIFIDDMTGVEVVNPAFPDMEGKNLIDIQDKWGKFIVRDYIREVYKYGKNQKSGWYHYLWPKPDTGEIAWKTSYIVRAVSPSTKKEYVVGSGIYNMKMEKAFMVSAVEDAVQLILKNKKGRGIQKAFDLIKSKSESFFYKNTYVFVTNEKGEELANPVFPQFRRKKIWDVEDAEKNPVFKDFIKVVKRQGSGWFVSVWLPKEDGKPLLYKHTYLKGITVDDKLLIIGTTAVLEEVHKKPLMDMFKK